jgi:hypothetical protein
MPCAVKREKKERLRSTLSELGHAIRRLACLAYPTAPLEVRETPGKDALIDTLVNSDIRLRIEKSRPRSLNDAIRISAELDAYSTTVIVKIKGKPRSLFCNKHTVIGNLIHFIIFNENKYVELICENKDVLVNFTSWI